jgi:hypothetical protein
MDRRSFLSRIFASAASLVAPAAVARSALDSSVHRVLLQESPLAGFQFYEGERLWPRLRVGQHLTLRRRSDNPHDPRAVEIWWRGRMLGHLQRVDNCAVAQMLDRGEPLAARITRLQESSSPWERVRFEVNLSESRS